MRTKPKFHAKLKPEFFKKYLRRRYNLVKADELELEFGRRGVRMSVHLDKKEKEILCSIKRKLKTQ